MRNKNNSWFTYIIFAIVGGGLFYFFSFQELQTTRSFVASAKHADGEVTDVVVGRGSKGATTFAPEVSFVNETGRQVKFVSSNSSSSPSFRKGEKVAVLYDPTLPEYAKIDSFSEIWLMPGLFGLFSLVFLFVGLGGIISKLRKVGLENNDITPQISA